MKLVMKRVSKLFLERLGGLVGRMASILIYEVQKEHANMCILVELQ
jgi:hypothetical protein